MAIRARHPPSWTLSARVQLDIVSTARLKLFNFVVDLVTEVQMKLYRRAFAFILPGIARVGHIWPYQDRLGAAIRATTGLVKKGSQLIFSIE